MVLGVHSFVDVFTGFLVGIAVLELIFFLRSKVKNELWLHIGLLSGLTIITDKPFQIGDFIKIGNYAGIIENITFLREWDLWAKAAIFTYY